MRQISTRDHMTETTITLRKVGYIKGPELTHVKHIYFAVHIDTVNVDQLSSI